MYNPFYTHNRRDPISRSIDFISRQPGIQQNQRITEVLTSEEAMEHGYPAVAERAKKEIATGAAFYALHQYARKKPLTFAGRVIGHGLPVVSLAFWAYDAYTIYDYFN
jgi:hypothetical protein